MKKKIIYLFIMIFVASCYAKTVTTEDGYLSLEIPEECGCIDIHHRNYSRLEIMGYFLTKPFICKTEFSIPFYKLLEENNFEINLIKLKEMLEDINFNENDDFAIDPSYRTDEFSGDGDKCYIGYLPKSYKPIIMDDVLGEEYFWLPVKYCIYNEYRATGFSYHITFALPDRLERISFGINSIDYSAEELVNSFPQWFEMRKDGLYYWINQECLDAMYDLLFSDDYKKLPRDLQLIRETRDMILQTVRINNPPVDTSKLTEGVITH